MAQRVLTVSCVVVTVASLSLAGLLWRQLNVAQRDAARQAAAAMDAMALQNEKAQATQQEMLKQMGEMSEAIRTTRSLDWNPVTFKVTEDTLDGPPVAGVSIALEEHGNGSGRAGMGQAASKPSVRVTDGSGAADFGVVRPGDYTFQVFRDWDQEYLTTRGELSIEPGSQVNKRIICPKAPLERVPVRVRAAWPADLEKENLVLHASFAFMPFQSGGPSWSLCDIRRSGPMNGSRFPPLASQILPANRAVLYGPATSMAQVLPAKTPTFWTLSDPPMNRFWADIRDADLRVIREPAEAMEWERGSYQFSGVIVLRSTDPASGDAGTRRFELVVMSHSREAYLGMSYYLVLDEPPAVGDVNAPRTKADQAKSQRTNWGRRVAPFNANGGSRRRSPGNLCSQDERVSRPDPARSTILRSPCPTS